MHSFIMLKTECQCHQGKQQNGDLNVECTAPTDGVIQHTSKRCTRTNAQSIYNIGQALKNASRLEGHKTRHDHTREGIQAAASKTGQCTSHQKLVHSACCSTPQGTQRKNGHGQQKTALTSEEITESSVQWCRATYG